MKYRREGVNRVIELIMRKAVIANGFRLEKTSMPTSTGSA